MYQDGFFFGPELKGGGIWLLWKADYKLDILKTHPQFVLARICRNDSSPWLLSVVYGSPNASLRNFLWQDLASNSIDLSDPWLAVRDFHSVTSSTEVSSNSRISNRRRFC